MNGLVRQDLWSLMPRLQEESNRLFGHMNQNDSSSATATGAPAVDVHEHADRFEFYINMPGVNPNKMELTLEGDILSPSGQRNEQRTDKRRKESLNLRTECGLGQFYRRVVLPDSVDSEKVSAARRNGYLPLRFRNEPRQCRAAARLRRSAREFDSPPPAAWTCVRIAGVGP